MADSRQGLRYFIEGTLFSGENYVVPGITHDSVDEYAIVRASGYVSSYYKDDMIRSIQKNYPNPGTPVTRRITVTIHIEEWQPVDDTGERVVGS